jgi:4-amino-4-deoxy-L-arabinose transferase-like glycosyltransferase
MKRIYLLVFLAFIARLALGVFASFYLPQSGYDTETQRAGYLFYDAYRRDTQAWDLASSSRPLFVAFDEKFATDQYGGLLWLSAFVYRYFSGETHQPLLMVFLAALAGSLGGIFVYLAAKSLLDEKSAVLASLVFLFYPEAILQGAAQMREPFLMTFVAMAFYAFVRLTPKPGELVSTRQPSLQNLPIMDIVWAVLALAGMLFISPGIALVTLVVAAGWIFFGGEGRRVHWGVVAGAAGVFLVALVVLTLSWDNLVAARGGGILGILGGWLRESSKWDAYLLGRSSGIVQLLFERLPRGLVMPFVAVYGILQPVLPAAIFEPSLPFWQGLGILRALGWYLLLPFVAFSLFSAWQMPIKRQQRPWFWLAVAAWAWILIASIRAGGDQWDNPRYRVILLAFLAILAIQAFSALKSPARRWFWRIVVVEVLILLVFSNWYLTRYFQVGWKIGIQNSLALALGAAVLAVVGDWAWEKCKVRQQIDKK